MDPINFGVEPEQESYIQKEKVNVSPYDVFKLGTWVLLTSTIIFVVFAMIRIFYHDDKNEDAIKEVWDFSKVLINSIVTLVLGLYFGRKESKSS